MGWSLVLPIAMFIPSEKEKKIKSQPHFFLWKLCSLSTPLPPKPKISRTFTFYLTYSRFLFKRRFFFNALLLFLVKEASPFRNLF